MALDFQDGGKLGLTKGLALSKIEIAFNEMAFLIQDGGSLSVIVEIAHYF